MTVKLFQDMAGTIPAVLAGQPVGFIKRTKGSDDARQATALSKPTYARWPRTGRRNLANYGQALNFALAWPDVRTEGGITYTKIGSGKEDGFDYVDYEATGVASIAGVKAIYDGNRPEMRIPVAAGVGVFQGRLQAKILAGSSVVAMANGIRIDLTVRSALNNELSNATSGYARSSDYTTLTVVKDIVEPDAAFVGIKVGFRSGQDEDIGSVRFRIRCLEAVHGDSSGAFQANYGPNDITEPGVPDLWHLYNDGGDSLNVTLPAGTYGLASIGIDRQIIVTTFVSDGTTPVNILRHERQLNVSYRLGAYSAAEEVAIRDAWGRKYA